MEINIPPQQIFAKSKPGGVIFEGGLILSEYGNNIVLVECVGFVLSAVLCIPDYIKLHEWYKPRHMEKQEMDMK